MGIEAGTSAFEDPALNITNLTVLKLLSACFWEANLRDFLLNSNGLFKARVENAPGFAEVGVTDATIQLLSLRVLMGMAIFLLGPSNLRP